MRSKIVFLGSLTPDEISEVSNFLGMDCLAEGEWAKYTRTDSPFKFAICSNGKHFIRLSGYDTNGTKFYRIKEVKTYVDTYGYIGVSGFSTMHQLVAEAFIPDFVPYPEKEVNHIDGDKFNNDIGNLELVLHKQNMEHFWVADCMAECRESWLSKHIGRQWSDAQREQYRLNPPRKHQWTDAERLRVSIRHKGKKLSPKHIAILKEANRGSHSNHGMIWVTDGITNCMIQPEDLSEWEFKGFRRGRTITNIPKHKKPYVHTVKFLEKQRLRKPSKEAI